MKQIFTFYIAFTFLLLSKVYAQKPEVTQGSIVYFKYNKSKYIDQREIAVWLPKNYNPSKKYTVIYMHDGKSLFDTAASWNHQSWEVDETMQQLISNHKIKDCILVGIYNAEWKRRSEYFPQKVFNSLSLVIQDSLRGLKDKNNNLVFNGAIQSDNYLKFIATELKPFVDSSFSTYKNAENTFIAGSSMGALISLYALCEYPTIFGGAACLSTHWTGTANYVIKEVPEAMLWYFRNHLPAKGKHKIYFDYGSLGLDSLYKPYQIKMDEILQFKNYTSKDWITKEFIGAGHHEEAWRARINIPFEFLLK